MAVLASLLGVVGRFAGKVLTTTLGWASTLLFGRIPEDRQVWFAILTFGSLIWVALGVGILLPDLGTMLIAFVPLPDWVSDDAVRIGMLAGAVILPALLGAVTLLIADPGDRPAGRDRIATILRGYPLTPVLAGTLAVLAIAGVVRKVRAIVARRESAHIAIVVRPRRYDALVDQLEAVLRGGDLVDTRREGSRVLTGAARLLARISGAGLGSLVPDRLAVLVGPELELEVYPSDLSLTGRTRPLARARATLMREIRSRDAWFTTTREAQQIEDRLASLDDQPDALRSPVIQEVDRRLATEQIDDDAWDVLYRRRLQLVADATGLDLAKTSGADLLAAPDVSARGAPQARPLRIRRPSLGAVLGAILAGLVVTDLILASHESEDRR